MENARLGPLPSPPAGTRARIGRPAAALLEQIEQYDAPVSLAQLAEATGLHPNTLRERLQQLVDIGLLERTSAPPVGRGRPAMLYRLAVRATSGDQVTEYAGLATTLAVALERISPTPAEDAATAGAAWGHDLARATGHPAKKGERAARRQVGVVLDRMGFAPRADEDHVTVRLTRCPLLEAAQQHPEVICSVHLGIAKGALAEYGADDSAVSLLPFAEPGACLLHLTSPERR